MASKQFVIFRLEQEFYGAEILNIQEIIIPKKPVRIPNNPDFIEGVIDYRDNEVIPVLDLKKRFNLGESAYDKDSRYIVANVDGKMVAFVVDEVTEILRTEQQEISNVPKMTKISKDYIRSVVSNEGNMIVIVDLSKILSIDEKDIIKKVKK